MQWYIVLDDSCFVCGIVCLLDIIRYLANVFISGLSTLRVPSIDMSVFHSFCNVLASTLSNPICWYATANMVWLGSSCAYMVYSASCWRRYSLMAGRWLEGNYLCMENYLHTLRPQDIQQKIIRTHLRQLHISRWIMPAEMQFGESKDLSSHRR